MLDQLNVPSVLDADIEVDVSGSNDFVVASDIKASMSQLDTSGGDYTYEQIQTWAGTLVGAGPQNIAVWTLTLVYSDGETSDSWEVLRAANGGNAAVRYVPKGETSGNRRHTLTGRLVQVSDPTPSGNAGFTFTAIFVGATSYAAVAP